MVDDDLATLEATVSLVEAMGFHAKGFPSAHEFLNSDLRLLTRCLILDIRMPGMSGIDLFVHLSRAGRAVPTILATAFPDEVTRSRSLLAGVTCYLRKPFHADELLACIRAALGIA
ncbi:response regulator transcription factor [Prosthecomicrobium sp. N25]|uniref:response regulator transcription factor n=1 Tax=Prosthecomicrobium sp. N25 TaxID=3129254 RepID=UPI0030773E83